jgi:hypothetical protein
MMGLSSFLLKVRQSCGVLLCGVGGRCIPYTRDMNFQQHTQEHPAFAMRRENKNGVFAAFISIRKQRTNASGKSISIDSRRVANFSKR